MPSYDTSSCLDEVSSDNGRQSQQPADRGRCDTGTRHRLGLGSRRGLDGHVALRLRRSSLNSLLLSVVSVGTGLLTIVLLAVDALSPGAAVGAVVRRTDSARGDGVHGGLGRVVRVSSLRLSLGPRRVDGRCVGNGSRAGLAALCRIGVHNRHALCRVSSSSRVPWLPGLGGVAGVVVVSRLTRLFGLARLARLSRVSVNRGVVVRLRRGLGHGMGVDGCESRLARLAG